MTESILLALVGATLGVFFAIWGSQLLVRMMSTTGRALSLDLTIDPSILAFTVVVATATGILFGLAPAWRTGRVDPHSAMKAHGRGVAEGHSRFSIGKALVVAQIALSLVLVAGAALLLGSWKRLANTDPGFKKDHVLLIATDARAGNVPDEQHAAVYRRILERLRALPGVRGASMSQLTPIGLSGWNNGIKADGFTPASKRDGIIWMNEVSDGYFATMGTPLLAGRDFGSSDIPNSSRVAIINEAMAKRVFGKSGAVCENFSLSQGKKYGPPIEIVGIVANAKYRSIRETDRTDRVRLSQSGREAGRPHLLRGAHRRITDVRLPWHQSDLHGDQPALHHRLHSTRATGGRVAAVTADTRDALWILWCAGAAAGDDRPLRHHVVQRRTSSQ